jgi:Domain of unknown function (DUF4266)
MNACARAISAAGALAVLALGGCANVKPYEREKLADPIMNLDNGMEKQSLERKVFSTREAAIGGAAGIAGGCGCAK